MQANILKKIIKVSERYPQKVSLRTNETSLNYADLVSAIIETSADLISFNSQVFGIDLSNCPEWVITDLSILNIKATNIPIPSFFSSEQINHLISDSSLEIMISDNYDKYQGNFSLIKTIKILQKELYIFKTKNIAPNLDYSKITYTSGTTGNPKGVCLTEVNIQKTIMALEEALNINQDDVHFSFLPYSVLLENIAGIYLPLMLGAEIFIPNEKELNFGSPTIDYQRVISIINEVKPSTTILVPHQLSALLQSIVTHGQGMESFKYIAVGGAHVRLSDLKLAKKLEIPVYQGYGMSETASVISVNTLKNNKLGTVGRVLDHLDIKIDSEGEILVKGNLFSGYLNQSSNLVDESGFYRTGDIGQIDTDGYLKILGRKKHIFINSFGRNISPEWLENELSSHPQIIQSAVFGESETSCSAVIFSTNQDKVNEAIKKTNSILPEYAQITRWVHAEEPFLISNGLLTLSGVVNRDAIWSKYHHSLTLEEVN
jgi:long-chain acyl-CoA synthetase